MSVHVHGGDVRLLDLKTRMPFKYGIATMTSTPHALVRVGVEVGGRVGTGVAADHLPPKWFTKDPGRAVEDEVEEMLRVIERAVQGAAGLRAPSVFAAWRQLFDRQDAWGRAGRLPPLLTHFGTSLVERAVIDAYCRLTGQAFAQALRVNSLGVRLGDIHPSLAGTEPSSWLPAEPRGHVVVRHTVGLADPLGEGDIAAGERLDDGLPQSLEACITAYGLRHFKIKISGDAGRDRERLARVSGVVNRLAPPDFAFSLDGNEQFHSLAEFRSHWEGLAGSPALREFFAHLLFVEQPLHRDVALSDGVGAAMAAWPGRPRIIIDESDGDLDSLPRALRLGYAGTSHKNCKGVFKGIANRCLVARRQAEDAGRDLLMSGEDLANIGPVALLQDLAVCAALGIASVERNGHHYFAGLSMFPARVQQEVLRHHGDLYHRGPAGWPTLTIREGRIQLGSVVAAPFGMRAAVTGQEFLTPDAWRASRRK